MVVDIHDIEVLYGCDDFQDLHVRIGNEVEPGVHFKVKSLSDVSHDPGASLNAVGVCGLLWQEQSARRVRDAAVQAIPLETFCWKR